MARAKRGRGFWSNAKDFAKKHWKKAALLGTAAAAVLAGKKLHKTYVGAKANLMNQVMANMANRGDHARHQVEQFKKNEKAVYNKQWDALQAERRAQDAAVAKTRGIDLKGIHGHGLKRLRKRK